MKPFLSFSLASLLALAAPALAQSPASQDPAQVQAGSYLVDPAHTQVGFRVSHIGFSNYAGGFSGVSGSLAIDPKKPSATKLSVTVPVASIATTSTVLTDELKGEPWLDAAKFPEMTFVSTKVAPKGKDKAKVTGDLTLHGVTKPVTLDVSFVGTGTNPLNKKVTVGFDATGTLKRSDFGVSTYVPMVGDELHLTIAGAFELKG